MEYRDTKEYLSNIAHQVNTVIEKVLFVMAFLGPVMWVLSTCLESINISTIFCVGYACVSLVCMLGVHYLNKMSEHPNLATFFGIVSLSILVPAASVKMHITVHVMYCITVFVSCLYMRVRITRLVTCINYIILILTTYQNMLGEMEIQEFVATRLHFFAMEIVNYTIEFAFLYGIAASIVHLMEQLLLECEELYKKGLEYQHVSGMKSEFLAQMSHEIRTPINAVLGMNEMIIQECTQPEVEGYAMTIRSAGKTLLNIINDVLDYSRIESGKMQILSGEYDVAASIKDVIDVFNVQCAAKGLRFVYEVPEDMPRYLVGDEFRIKQAVSNLLSNAVKYTDEGTIRLHVDFYRKSEDRGRMVISVIDTGIGIRQEDLGKLFQKYSRLDLRRNRTIQGTGLGLKICKQTVELMGGVLSVQSEYGEGSVFSIALDQIIQTEEVIGDFYKTSEVLGEQVIQDAKKKDMVYVPNAEIMIVDDNEMNLQVASNLLKKTGCKIQCFLSGQECLDEVHRKHYDLILLDHMMPEPDGIAVLKELRSNKEHLCQDTKIVVLTANAIIGAREQYLETGFDDYISKPISIEELDKVLRNNLNLEILEAEVERPHEANRVNEENGYQKADIQPETFVVSEPGFDLSKYHIDVEKGVSYLGDDWENYISMVDIFCKDYMKRTEKLGQAMEADNLADYAVLVHGLKGNARTLGADALGELAFEEEKAAKDNNMEFLEEHQYQLDEEWRLVLEGFERLLRMVNNEDEPERKEEVSTATSTAEGTNENLQEVLDEELEDQILMAMACLEGRQKSQAEEILRELLNYDMGNHVNSCVEQGLKALMVEDFQRSIECLNKVWREV